MAYEWLLNYGDIDCFIDNIPANNYAATYPDEALSQITDIAECSRIPIYCLLAKFRNWYNSNLNINYQAITFNFCVLHLDGIEIRYNNNPLVNYNITRNYNFTYTDIVNIEVRTDWETVVKTFLENYNCIQDKKLKILLENYGINIKQQNNSDIWTRSFSIFKYNNDNESPNLSEINIFDGHEFN